MKKDYYKDFISIVEMGSLTKAAEHMYIAQPALSKYVTKLENEFGVKLFIRAPRKMVPTEEGLALYHFAKQLDLQEKNLQKKMIDLSQGNTGTLRLGIIESGGLLNSSLQNLFPKFNKTYPHVKYEIYSGISQTLLNYLRDGICDVIIISDPVLFAASVQDLRIKIFEPDPLVLCCKSKNLLKGMPLRISLNSIRSLPICIPRSIAPYVGAACRMDGFSPNIIATLPSVEACINFISNINVCSTLTLKSISNISTNKLNYLIIDDRKVAHVNALVTLGNKALPRVARNFIQYCEKEYKLTSIDTDHYNAMPTLVELDDFTYDLI